MNRRHFISSSFSALGALMLPRLSIASLSTINSEPHFFIYLEALGGLDCAYTFDARSIEMSKQGKAHSHSGLDRIEWIGRNGNQTIASGLIKPLIDFKDYFSVINGVHMFPSFEGHDENYRYMITGNPFEAENFIPHLNGLNTKFPIDAVNTSLALLAEGMPGTNAGNIVPLSEEAGTLLPQYLHNYGLPLTNAASNRYLLDVHSRLSKTTGRLGIGSKLMMASLYESESLGNKIKKVSVEKNPDDDPFKASLRLLLSCFKEGLTSSGIIPLISDPSTIDIHDGEQARSLPTVIHGVVGNIIGLIETLRATPFSNNQSFFDVTTFMVATEFARTLRQIDIPIENTGTDHNPLTNSILIGGRGIKGGLVIGNSDFTSADEILSDAHKALDPQFVKAMGRPFDFATETSTKELPPTYNISNYLGVNSVINTIYNCFGIDKTLYRPRRQGNPELAPILRTLVSRT